MKERFPPFSMNLTWLIRKALNIAAIVESSADYDLANRQSERRIGSCKQVHTDIYVSGLLASGHLDKLLCYWRTLRLNSLIAPDIRPMISYGMALSKRNYIGFDMEYRFKGPKIQEEHLV
jgi:hypothetical protein